jgi:hypothetical protein
MYKAERIFLRWHKNNFWILCHGISTMDLEYHARFLSQVFLSEAVVIENFQ